jgi:NADH:ubiquinone oxidoreductase subunit 2 (subunit N)
METGFSLLAISLLGSSSQQALSLFFTLILPRGLSLSIWGLALAALQKAVMGENRDLPVEQALTYRYVQGIARRYPFAAAAALLAHFSLAGFPLLAGFPVRLALLDALSGESISLSLAGLFGLAGLMAGGIRTLAVFISAEGALAWESLETIPQRLLLGLGAVMLVLVGLFPQWFTPFMVQMLAIFPNLSR